MIRTAVISLALALCAAQAQALTPLPPCDGNEGGMYVHSADLFGFDGSGFILEAYVNQTTEDGVIAGAKGPIPELDGFNGMRDALYGDEPGIRILSLRETEETCACSEYYPGVWTQ